MKRPKRGGNDSNPPEWTQEEYERALQAVKARTEVVVFIVSLNALVHISAFPEGGVTAWRPRYLNSAKRWVTVRDSDVAPHEAWWLACMCAGLRDAIDYALAPAPTALALVPQVPQAPATVLALRHGAEDESPSYRITSPEHPKPFAEVIELHGPGYSNDNVRADPTTCPHKHVRPLLSIGAEECCACGMVAEMGSM